MTGSGTQPAGDRSAHAIPAGDRGVRPFSRPRTVLALARVEAFLLARSVLVLIGLVASGATIWILIGSEEPLWWSVAWRIGFGQLILGMAVLTAAQLAAGRPRRDAMSDLYASFPATAGTRTLGHVAGLAGALPASLLLIGATAVVAQLRAAIGTPDLTVLAGGLVIVIAAGAAGIAIAGRFPHPLAGMLGALALLLSSGTSHTATGAWIWLLPWEWTQDQLSYLPGPLAGYPPAGAHMLELGGIAVLAVTAALATASSRARVWTRGALTTAGILALAAICLAGNLQLRPIPSAQLNYLVTEAAHPASVQACTTANQVRYCLYPGFGRQLASLEEPVNAVLALLPARPARAPTVRQVLSPYLLDSTLTHGHPSRQVARWKARLSHAPSNGITPASAINLPVGSWPAGGGPLTAARFDLALATAEWAVRLPGAGDLSTSLARQCVPVGQARAAIAIWLAVIATHLPAGELSKGLGTLATGIPGTEVRGTFVRTWDYPGIGMSYVEFPGGGMRPTATGYLLASAMTRLPEQKVYRVLADSWARWLNWHTTDAQLAAALRIRVPSISAATQEPGPGPQSPLCTG